MIRSRNTLCLSGCAGSSSSWCCFSSLVGRFFGLYRVPKPSSPSPFLPPLGLSWPSSKSFHHFCLSIIMHLQQSSHRYLNLHEVTSRLPQFFCTSRCRQLIPKQLHLPPAYLSPLLL